MLKFPLLTSPTLSKEDYLNEFQGLLDKSFSELIIISPFVDGKAIENILTRFVFREGRRLTIVTRYRNLFKVQKEKVDAAIKKTVSHAKKDPSLNDRVEWYRNEKLHAKLVIKDWELLLFGSQNLTYSGMKSNYELGAMISDKRTVERLRDFVNDVIKQSKVRKLFP